LSANYVQHCSELLVSVISTDLLRQLVVVAESSADGGLGACDAADVLLLFNLESLSLGVSQLSLSLHELAVVQLIRLHRLQTGTRHG